MAVIHHNQFQNSTLVSCPDDEWLWTCCLMALASLYSGLILSSLFLWKQQKYTFLCILIFSYTPMEKVRLLIQNKGTQVKIVFLNIWCECESQKIENQLLQTSKTPPSFILLRFILVCNDVKYFWRNSVFLMIFTLYIIPKKPLFNTIGALQLQYVLIDDRSRGTWMTASTWRSRLYYILLYY